MNEKNAEKKVVSLLVVSILAMASFVPIAIADQPGQPIPRFIYGYCYYMNYGGTPATYANVKLTNSTGAILQIMTDEYGIYVADVGSAGWQVGEDVLIEVFGNASQGYDGWYGRAETTVPLTGIWKNITLKPPGWGGLNEGFEGGAIPSGWTVINNDGDTYQWEAYNAGTGAHTGSWVARVHWNSAGNDDWLITPHLSVKAGDKFSFWAKSYSSSYLEDFEVWLSTAGNTIPEFTVLLGTVHNVPYTWTYYEYDLSTYAGQQVYIAIRCISVNDFYLYVDDVVGPSLALPDDDFGATSITISPAQTALVPYYEQGTDITIDVTVKNFGENSWDEVPVTVKITNYETSTVVYQQTKYTHVIGKLQTETISFTWHAETVCLHIIEAYTELPGDENPANDAAPVKYVGIYKQGGIFESFEGTYPPTYWSQVNTSTSTSYAIHGSYSVYFSYLTVTERILVTPRMTVASGDTFAFWFLKAYTSSAGEYFRVEYGSDLTGWTELMNLSYNDLNGMNSYTWYYFSFDLSSLAGQTIQIRFYYAPKGGASIWIDAVKASVMAPYHNAAVISIDAPVSGPAGLQVPAATIKNKGTVQDTFDVTFNIYQIGGSLLSEGFETSVPPPGWTEQIVNDPGTDPDWSQVSSGTNPSCTPHSGSYMAKFNSFNCPSTASARLYTNMLDFSSYPNLFLAFWMYHDTGYPTKLDRIVIQYSLDGSTWNDIATIYRYDGSTGWKQHTLDLSSYVGGQSQAWIGFLAISDFGNNMYIDDVEIRELTLVYTDSGQITLPAGQQGQITFDPWLGLVGTYLVTVDVTVADDYDLTDNHMATIITLTDNIPPEITNVQAIPQSQTNAPPNFVNITAEVTDNVQVALVEAIITYPDSSVHTFPMNEAKGIYYLNQEYTDVGTYYFDIHAVDIYNNENTATGYWFEITENNPPDAPTNPYPANGATGVPVTTVMSVDVSDPDNEPLTVYFYWANNTLIGTASNVPSGGTATIGPITLNELTTYEWYAVAFDGMYSTPSPTWSFTTGMAMPPYIEIGNPASTTCTGYVPTYGFWDYSWSAVIYLQSEIGYEFDIVKIAYDVCNNPAMYTFQNQKIYMGHTTLSSWPDSTQPDNSTLTLVYEGPITFNGPGWHEIELQTPFHYNNVDNLVIYWENQDGSWASGYPTFRYTSQTNRAKYDYADYTWPPPAPGYVGAYMANIRLYRQINYDVGVKSINYPLNGSAIGETTPVFVNATVKNYGAQPATFNVNCTITKIVKEEKPLWVYEDFTATWTDQNGDGFTEPPGWINDVYNTGPSTYYYPYWHQNTAYYHTSPAAAFVWWDYEDQDEYLITPQIDLTTATNPKLEFYSYVYRGSTYGDHYWVDISTDDGQTWTHLLDFSSLSGGWDYWGTLYQIDLSAYTGQVV
ncbi:MAG: choice-of-anchor J domain-containing protein, partial [Candidatus Thermoplasmatota archaeon]